MTITARRAHLGFVVELTRPVKAEDADLLDGHYIDMEDQRLGEVILETRTPARRFLLIVADDVVAVHVEAALENDSRTESRARRAVLRYPYGKIVPPGVLENGDAWKTNDYVAYAFVSEDQAMLDQRRI